MKDFGVILNEYLEKLEITQSNAAQLIGCSRSMIYSVLNGEKQLTESKFQNMLSVFNFTDEQISKLRYAYYKDKYPTGAIDRIFQICHYMAGHHEKETSINIPVLQITSSSVSVKGKQELAGLISAIILDENVKVITTNFSFKDKTTDDAVFNALTKRKNSVDFRHIITFDSSNKSDVNIRNLFLSLRYIRHGFNPLYRYSDKITDDSIYPYYIITDKYVLFFNSEHSCGMFITEEDIIRSTSEMAKSVLDNCSPLAQYPVDVFELKNSVTKVSSNRISYALGNSACILPLVPEKIESFAADDLPNKDLLIKIAVDHYTKLSQHTGTVLFPLSALERFAKEGKVYNFPLSWTKPMSFENRQYVLDILKKYVSGDNPKIKILHDHSVGLSDKYFSLDIFERYMSIAGSLADSKAPYCGEFSVFIKNTNIISDFRFYIDYIRRNRIHLKPEIAAAYMDSLKLECERNKK